MAFDITLRDNGAGNFDIALSSGAPANVLISQARQAFRVTWMRVWGRMN